MLSAEEKLKRRTKLMAVIDEFKTKGSQMDERTKIKLQRKIFGLYKQLGFDGVAETWSEKYGLTDKDLADVQNKKHAAEVESRILKNTILSMLLEKATMHREFAARRKDLAKLYRESGNITEAEQYEKDAEGRDREAEEVEQEADKLEDSLRMFH